MEEMRLQKYLALAGVASRRGAEELIRQGRVSVNGRIVTEMGLKVHEADLVEVDGKRTVLEEKKVYIMLNKPCGYVSTAKDQFSRKTVLDLVPEIKERIYPVGRLDYDTSGLLLLTNDGDFAFRMTHPSHEIRKVYQAHVEGAVGKKEIEAFKKGILLDDYKTSPAELKIIRASEDSSTIEISIHEGKNRQVRKMCEAVGHPVINLKRISVGNLRLDGLEEGKWRYLTEKELSMMK